MTATMGGHPMRRTTTGAVLALAAAGAVVVGRRVRKQGTSLLAGQDRWHSVTIYRSPEEVGHLPEPLAALGETIEVRVRPAPAGRGTELAARLAKDVPAGLGKVTARIKDDDPVGELRRALREAKQLAEIGEIVRPDGPPTTERTLTSRPLEYATNHGRKEGRL
jgi:hypothetical protein